MYPSQRGSINLHGNSSSVPEAFRTAAHSDETGTPDAEAALPVPGGAEEGWIAAPPAPVIQEVGRFNSSESPIALRFQFPGGSEIISVIQCNVQSRKVL